MLAEDLEQTEPEQACGSCCARLTLSDCQSLHKDRAASAGQVWCCFLLYIDICSGLR